MLRTTRAIPKNCISMIRIVMFPSCFEVKRSIRSPHSQDPTPAKRFVFSRPSFPAYLPDRPAFQPPLSERSNRRVYKIRAFFLLVESPPQSGAACPPGVSDNQSFYHHVHETRAAVYRREAPPSVRRWLQDLDR